MKKILTAELPADYYIAGYRDVQYFIGLCRQCRNYGHSWLCPPFEFDADEKLSRWSNVLIVACHFDLPEGENRVEDAMSLLHVHRIDLETRLLAMENEYGGLACGFSGECLHCRKCARIKNAGCIHPGKARPALEAYGFNVAKTLKDILGIDIEWGKDGLLPPTLTLVGALFHNCPQGLMEF